MKDLDFRLDRGFMGLTHALSGVALALALTAFAPGFVQWAGWTTPALVLLVTLVISGSALLPDLDNNVSTARNSLGFLGYGLSFFFRGTSRFIQTVLRTKRDDKEPNPHRGFWHTIPAALLLGLGVWALTGISAKFTLPLLGEVSVGWVGALLVTYATTHLAFAGLFSKLIRKVLKGSRNAETLVVILSIVAVVAVFWMLPRDQSFWWLSVAVTIGAIAHILGDSFTTAGVPLLFPLSAFLRGKFWWTTRFSSMKAGSDTEKIWIFAFAIISVGSLVWILIKSFN